MAIKDCLPVGFINNSCIIVMGNNLKVFLLLTNQGYFEAFARIASFVSRTQKQFTSEIQTIFIRKL